MGDCVERFDFFFLLMYDNFYQENKSGSIFSKLKTIDNKN